MNTETISDAEVDNLLKAAAMRDQRTIGATDIAAWYQDLNTARVTYADAVDAVSRYYAEVWPRQDPARRFRITAPVLIELVIDMRRRRIADSNYVFEPRFGETGAQTADRMRRELAHIAAGHEMPRQLGHPLRARPVAELVAGLAAKSVLPPEIAAVVDKLHPPAEAVTCPSCNARPGAACTLPGTRRTRAHAGFMHPGRTASWAIAVTGCPDCRADAGQVCRQLGQPYHDHAHPARITAARGTRPENGA